MIHCKYILTFSMILISTLIAFGQENNDIVFIKFDIYKVLGGIAGDTSMTDNVWEGINKSTKLKPIEEHKFFDTTDLTVAGTHLLTNEKEWTWNGKEKPPETGGIELLSSPAVIVRIHESFAIESGSEVPAMQYYEKRSDGLFEIKSMDPDNCVNTGFRISSRIEEGPSNRIILKDFFFEMSSIDFREKIDGVDLDVGKPVIIKKEIKTDLAIKPDCNYGLLVRSKGEGALIIKFRASWISEQDQLK